MKQNNNNILLFLLMATVLLSCASRKDIVYLQKVDYEGKSLSNDIENTLFKSPIFKIDDRITVNISSINPEAARPFNLYLTSFNTGGVTASGAQQQQSYLVDSNGEIAFPQLGKIKVIDKNRIELESFLEEKIKPFLPDVKANVQLVNFRISVLGEVKKPGDYGINRDKTSILQAIAMAGDLTIHAKRNNIILVREVNGKIKYHNIDVRSRELISSPVYYLQQNDIIYVSPNKPKVNASASSPTASYIISATGLLITIISILTR